ncbi:hypothetical protein [Oryzomonas rubra]|uniref:Uncharacterized protein n=1 Tax=Oryzomonas rubra TaxID=2509454 RepID=A0A5A9X8I6_9BACT|nr:hypothetical protein [Oryzomonas rubra]KAA0888705.1 hypothetical protein ET418_15100 [Oryzomonas rubra]
MRKFETMLQWVNGRRGKLLTPQEAATTGISPGYAAQIMAEIHRQGGGFKEKIAGETVYKFDYQVEMKHIEPVLERGRESARLSAENRAAQTAPGQTDEQSALDFADKPQAGTEPPKTMESPKTIEPWFLQKMVEPGKYALLMAAGSSIEIEKIVRYYHNSTGIAMLDVVLLPTSGAGTTRMATINYAHVAAAFEREK